MNSDCFKNDKNKNLGATDSLLRFTGERLPQYRWLRQGTLAGVLETAGQEK